MSEPIHYEILGDFCPGLKLDLPPGQEVLAEPGAMLSVTPQVEIDTSVSGGFLRGLKRKFLAGESLFMTRFIASAPGASVLLAAPYPGQILPLYLDGSNHILCQRSAFLCSVGPVDLSIALIRRLRTGFLGGEGFILQRLEGNGLAFIHAGGTLREVTLAPGENLRVDTGCLVALEESIDYDIQYVGGIKKAFFGGEGLFFASLTGPGTVWLQTLPIEKIFGAWQRHSQRGGLLSAIVRIFS